MSTVPCKFFSAPSGCYKGDSCTFSHTKDSGSNKVNIPCVKCGVSSWRFLNQKWCLKCYIPPHTCGTKWCKKLAYGENTFCVECTPLCPGATAEQDPEEKGWTCGNPIRG